MSSNNIVNVAAEVALLHTAILVTTVVVEDGTVYRVVLDVAAAVLASALDVVAISYYLPFLYLESIMSSTCRLVTSVVVGTVVAEPASVAKSLALLIGYPYPSFV
jgi:hypothetical protein